MIEATSDTRDPRWGQIREEKTTDENGSTVTKERNIVDNKTIKPIRLHYAFRVKVKDKKEEMTEYLKFTDSLDKNKLDPKFEIEHTQHGTLNGYYFIVKKWTELDYS